MKPEFPKIITSSLRETFNKCHRKHYLETITGTAPKGMNIHLEFGSAYAAGLEYFRRSYYGGEYAHLTVRDRFEQAATDGFIALMTRYGEFQPAEGETKTFDRLVGAYVEYLYHYPPETDHVQPSMFEGKPRVEFSFLFEIPECKHPVTEDSLLFAGRFDLLGEYTGALMILDDKTTGAMGPQWSKQWNLRSQFTAYAAGAHLAQKPVMGAIVRGMCILKTMFKTAESIQYRPPWMIARWKERLVWDVKRMLRCWKDEYWPHTGEESGACSDYGGCPFVLLCSSPNETAFRASEYMDYRYDPLQREGGKIDEAITNAKAQGNVFPWESVARNI